MEQNKNNTTTMATHHIEEPASGKHAEVSSVGLTSALVHDQISPWTASAFQLYWLIAVTGLVNCASGFDSTLMSSLNAMDSFHHRFGTAMSGSGTGLHFSIYAIGQLIGALFAAPASDTFGRRFGMFVGGCFIVLGAILQVTAAVVGQYIGGRFLIGFGISLLNTAGPVYLVEVSLPQWRGRFGGLSHVIGFYSGALACTWITYGTGFLSETNWSWKIPTLIQIIPSTIVLVSAVFVPESPRWQFANNRKEKARNMIVRYHGNGDPNAAIVAYQCEQIEADIEFEIATGQRRWWDYKILFSTREMLHRLWLLFLVSVVSQFIGGSVISYFMPVMLENAGITSSHKQLLMNAINVILSMTSGIVGSFFVDRWGRRNLFIWGTFLTGLVYIPINVIALFPASRITTSMGYGFIACIFLYGIFFSFCWTPLQNLYPAEVLPNNVRAKGMAFQGLMSGAANFINLYATPVALKNIGWKMYTIFLVFHMMLVVMFWIWLPETKGRSIEELEGIFKARNPVKASLEKQEVLAVDGKGVEVVGPTGA